MAKPTEKKTLKRARAIVMKEHQANEQQKKARKENKPRSPRQNGVQKTEGAQKRHVAQIEALSVQNSEIELEKPVIRKAAQNQPEKPVVRDAMYTKSVSQLDSVSKLKPVDTFGKWEIMRLSGVYPCARWGATAVMISDTVCIIYGGESDTDVANGCTLGDLRLLDTASGTWTRPVNTDGIPRVWHTATNLPGRNAMIVFGLNFNLSTLFPSLNGYFRRAK
jgi:hypothetical protein